MHDITGITVEFTQSTYTVNEDLGSLRPVLVLSSPSSYLITIEVFSTNGSAAGTCCTIYLFS